MKIVRGLACVVLIAMTLTLSQTEVPPVSALSPVIGYLDGIAPDGDRSMVVTGWALTADYPLSALGVRVKVDGQRAWVNYNLANTYRPDVGAAYPGYGNYHGFAFRVPVASGSHNVCVEAQNAGVYTQLANCYDIVVSAPDGARFSGIQFPATPGDSVPFTSTYWISNASTANPTYVSAIQNGVASWGNSGLTAGYTSGGPGGSPGSAIARFYIGNYSTFLGGTNHLGGTISDPCQGGTQSLSPYPETNCVGSYSSIYINSDPAGAFSGASFSNQQKVAAHEFGHHLGLYHPPTPGTPTVMAQGFIGGNVAGAPSGFDVGSFLTVYPFP